MKILISSGFLILLSGTNDSGVISASGSSNTSAVTVLLFCVLILAAIMAFVWVFFGELLITYFPTVKNFHSTRERWGRLHIKKTLKSAYEVSEIGQLRFEELSQSGNDPNVVNEVRHKRFSDVVTIVSHKERDLHHLTSEMRVYSAVFLILLVTGILTNADKFSGKSFAEISEAFFSYHIIPLLEVIMIVYLIIRFTVEMQSIKSLLKEQE